MSDHFRRWKPYMVFRAADCGAPCDYEIIERKRSQRVKLDLCGWTALRHQNHPDICSWAKPAAQKNHVISFGWLWRHRTGKALLGLCPHFNAPQRRINVWHRVSSTCLSADRDLTPHLLPRTTCTAIWRITVENSDSPCDHSVRLHAIPPLLFTKLERIASPCQIIYQLWTLRFPVKLNVRTIWIQIYRQVIHVYQRNPSSHVESVNFSLLQVIGSETSLLLFWYRNVETRHILPVVLSECLLLLLCSSSLPDVFTHLGAPITKVGTFFSYVNISVPVTCVFLFFLASLKICCYLMLL